MQHVATLADLWQAVVLFFENVDIYELIQRHGTWFYTITFVWAFLEGETFLIFAGAAAAQGALDVWILMLCAATGTFCGDNVYFLLGRRFGHALLNKNPKRKRAAEKVFELLRKYDVAFILAYRYLYGVRMISAFAIGMSGMDFGKYAFWNGVASALWAFSFAMTGYLFGEVLENVMGDIHYVMIGLVVAVAGFFAVKALIKKFRHHRHKWPWSR